MHFTDVQEHKHTCFLIYLLFGAEVWTLASCMLSTHSALELHPQILPVLLSSSFYGDTNNAKKLFLMICGLIVAMVQQGSARLGGVQVKSASCVSPSGV
jgi:hypothetical protein